MPSPEGFRDLAPLIMPGSVAVVGASASPGKLGHTVFKNIVEAGFPGRIVPVNPRAETLLGLPCAKSLDELPEPVDLAVIIIPAGAVPEAIAALGVYIGVKAYRLTPSRPVAEPVPTPIDAPALPALVAGLTPGAPASPAMNCVAGDSGCRCTGP
jgi:hypothetical protein